MKYFVFWVAALGVPPLSFLLALNKRWLKYAFWAMIAALCIYQDTAINFFSFEDYRGTSRGMEISLIHLLSFAVLGTLAIKRHLKEFVPATGFVLYIAYAISCVPSMFEAENVLFSWFEIWKMIMLYVFYLSVYSYLKSSGDIKSVMQGLAVFVIINFLSIIKDHLTGVYQPHGFFPHQNSMAVALHLFTSLFFAYYMMMSGLRHHSSRLFTFAFIAGAGSIVRSYSRAAIVMIPIALGISFICCIFRGRARHWQLRIMPVAIAAVAGLILILPRIIERFKNAPEASANTRVELALCAKEMIFDKPWTGVGINNWGIKINPPYDYAERAGRETNRDEDFEDGIVETVYLLTAAECGIPALLLFLAWLAWNWWSCWRLMGRLKHTRWFFIPAGLFGGLTVTYLQSCLEWVLKQPQNLICLMFMFATISYLNNNWKELVRAERAMKAKP